MPELPEVETTLRGLKKHLIGQMVSKVIIRFPKLRWPIPENLSNILSGQVLRSLTRRAKYLLFAFDHGVLILHLGMSGSLRIVDKTKAIKKHDHVDIEFNNGKILRFTDPRRFGALLWSDEKEQHSLLANLGPEPLTSAFTADYLWKKSRAKKVSVKNFIMNAQIVSGVGNIYATESLFVAGVNPRKSAGKLTQKEYERLVHAIKAVLKKAIKKGGTTLKDFADTSGKPGYFRQELIAYGRAGLPCLRCGSILKCKFIGQRNTVFCNKCQK